MQERVKTSFIPKASLQTERLHTAKGSPIGIINVVASIILIFAILAAVGLFIFEQFTVQNLDRKRASLDRARAAFEPATIKELSRLNTRLTVGGTLLSGHIMPSVIFDELERITLSSVRFSDFSFSEVSPGRFEVSMAGSARSFNALALQSDAFGGSELFTGPIFEGLDLDDTGNVVFSVTATVDASRMRFDGSVGGRSAAPSDDSGSPDDEVTP